MLVSSDNTNIGTISSPVAIFCKYQLSQVDPRDTFCARYLAVARSSSRGLVMRCAVLPVLLITSCLHMGHGGMSTLLQRSAPLRRRAQDNVPVASYWLRRHHHIIIFVYCELSNRSCTQK